MTEPMPEIQTLKPVARPGRVLPLFERRVVAEALSAARPGGFVLLEGPAGSGKSSAVSACTSSAVVAAADGLSGAELASLAAAGVSAGSPVLLTATDGEARLRLLAGDVMPAVIDADELRFDLAEVTRAAELAGVRLSRRQLASLAARTQGRPALVARILGALPVRASVTDATVDAVWARLASTTVADLADRFGASWVAVAPLLISAPVLTDALRARLAEFAQDAEDILSVLIDLGIVAPTVRFGEPVLTVAGLDAAVAGPAVDATWTALVTAEYTRIGADLELAALYADAADWSALRELARRRHAVLLRSPERAAELLSRIPSAQLNQDAWLIVVERMLSTEAGLRTPPRRLRKPVGAMPPAERAWLQAGKLRLEIAEGSFSKSVAEATYLTRILDQADLADDDAAELWLQSALPPFHTGAYAEAALRLTGALGLADRGNCPHVELSATGLLALCHALRGDLATAADAVGQLNSATLARETGTVWSIPAYIALAVVRVESGDIVGAQRALDAVRYDRLGAFWALYAAIAGRVALGEAGPDLSVDRLRVIEQFAGDIPASNHERGLFAAAVALIQLSAGRARTAAETLAGFDDGRESTLLPSALAELVMNGREAAIELLDLIDGRRVSALVRVSAAAVRLGLATGDDVALAAERVDVLAAECHLQGFAALIAGIASR